MSTASRKSYFCFTGGFHHCQSAAQDIILIDIVTGIVFVQDNKAIRIKYVCTNVIQHN